MNDNLAAGNSGFVATCAFCHRYAEDLASYSESRSICGDCKFLLLQDYVTPIQEGYRTPLQSRRHRLSSNSSFDNLFLQHSTLMSSPANQTQAFGSEYGNDSIDGTASTLAFQSSSLTTPSGSSPTLACQSSSRNDSDFVAICAFCHRHLLSEDLASDSESRSTCRDCKFLLLQDYVTLIQEGHRTPLQSRRRMYSSDSSFDNLFLQHSTHMTSPVNQIQAFGSEYGNDSIDGNVSASMLAFQSSSHTTPSRSRRWRSLSRTESEMYDSDSSLSFGVCSVFQGRSDIIAHGVHLWDSDISVGYNSSQRDTDSDTDIDPMNAGFYSWDSDEAAYNEWEGMDTGNDTSSASRVDNNVGRGHVPSLYDELPEVFDEMIESLAGTVDSRIGAPPASVSFVDNLPQIEIKEDHHEKINDLNCAICKDSLPVDTVVKQLPCFHMYHSYCILPWLSTRNSCPLCRYELPTDDPDYEEKKQRERSRSRLNTDIITEPDTIEENDSSVFGDAQADFGTDRHEPDNINVVELSQGNGRRCFFLAAAPVVGIVSIVLMFCFGNSVRHRRWIVS